LKNNEKTIPPSSPQTSSPTAADPVRAARPVPAPGDPAVAGPTPAGARRKAGRPKGRKNIPKPVALPRVKRKLPEELRDTRAGIEGYVSDLQIVVNRHNKEHGTALKAPTVDEILGSKAPTPAGPPSPTIPAEECTIGVMLLIEITGRILHVDSRPEPALIAAAGQRLSVLSGYFKVVDPVYVAAGAAILSVGACLAPLVVEKMGGAVSVPSGGELAPPPQPSADPQTAPPSAPPVAGA